MGYTKFGGRQCIANVSINRNRGKAAWHLWHSDQKSKNNTIQRDVANLCTCSKPHGTLISWLSLRLSEGMVIGVNSSTLTNF
jgi:hypothetical protein